MPTVSVQSSEGETIEEIELSERVFGAEINEALLHEAVIIQLGNRRAGTAATKTRSMVRGGGRKPWRQKGTGRARAGSIRSPLWQGGGVTFGPEPRDFRRKLPNKARRGALRSALSAKLGAGELTVLDAFDFDRPKTSQVVELLENLEIDRKALLVYLDEDENLVLSARNIPGVETMRAADLNTYDVLNAGRILISRDALLVVEEVLA